VRVKVNTNIAGPQYNCSAGSEIEFSDAVARALIKAGYAVAVGEVEVETATALPAPETTSKRSARKKRAGGK